VLQQWQSHLQLPGQLLLLLLLPNCLSGSPLLSSPYLRSEQTEWSEGMATSQPIIISIIIVNSIIIIIIIIAIIVVVVVVVVIIIIIIISLLSLSLSLSCRVNMSTCIHSSLAAASLTIDMQSGLAIAYTSWVGICSIIFVQYTCRAVEATAPSNAVCIDACSVRNYNC